MISANRSRRLALCALALATGTGAAAALAAGQDSPPPNAAPATQAVPLNAPEFGLIDDLVGGNFMMCILGKDDLCLKDSEIGVAVRRQPDGVVTLAFARYYGRVHFATADGVATGGLTRGTMKPLTIRPDFVRVNFGAGTGYEFSRVGEALYMVHDTWIGKDRFRIAAADTGLPRVAKDLAKLDAKWGAPGSGATTAALASAGATPSPAGQPALAASAPAPSAAPAAAKAIPALAAAPAAAPEPAGIGPVQAQTVAIGKKAKFQYKLAPGDVVFLWVEKPEKTKVSVETCAKPSGASTSCYVEDYWSGSTLGLVRFAAGTAPAKVDFRLDSVGPGGQYVARVAHRSEAADAALTAALLRQHDGLHIVTNAVAADLKQLRFDSHRAMGDGRFAFSRELEFTPGAKQVFASHIPGKGYRLLDGSRIFAGPDGEGWMRAESGFLYTQPGTPDPAVLELDNTYADFAGGGRLDMMAIRENKAALAATAESVTRLRQGWEKRRAAAEAKLASWGPMRELIGRSWYSSAKFRDPWSTKGRTTGMPVFWSGKWSDPSDAIMLTNYNQMGQASQIVVIRRTETGAFVATKAGTSGTGTVEVLNDREFRLALPDGTSEIWNPRPEQFVEGTLVKDGVVWFGTNDEGMAQMVAGTKSNYARAENAARERERDRKRNEFIGALYGAMTTISNSLEQRNAYNDYQNQQTLDTIYAVSAQKQRDQGNFSQALQIEQQRLQVNQMANLRRAIQYPNAPLYGLGGRSQDILDREEAEDAAEAEAQEAERRNRQSDEAARIAQAERDSSDRADAVRREAEEAERRAEEEQRRAEEVRRAEAQRKAEEARRAEERRREAERLAEEKRAREEEQRRAEEERNRPVTFTEGVVLCEPRANSQEWRCTGPLQMNILRLDAEYTNAQLGLACGSSKGIHEHGSSGKYRVFGCGFGIHPDPDVRKSYPGNRDVAADFGVFVPARHTYHCPRSKLAYCTTP